MGTSPDGDAYTRQLKALLPPGRLWRLDLGSALYKVLNAVAQEFARVDGRGENLIDEWDPSTAVELLPDWERILGLDSSGTDAQRQAAAATQYLARGGQTPAYFISLAASLGFVATITQTGLGAYVWRLNVDLAASSSTDTVIEMHAYAGSAHAGDRVSSFTIPSLEAVIIKASPAHTIVLFQYT